MALFRDLPLPDSERLRLSSSGAMGASRLTLLLLLLRILLLPP